MSDTGVYPAAPLEAMTWEQLELERRTFLETSIAQGLSFETIAVQNPAAIKRYIDICHRARMMVKPAGKPARVKKLRAKSLDDIML